MLIDPHATWAHVTNQFTAMPMLSLVGFSLLHHLVSLASFTAIPRNLPQKLETVQLMSEVCTGEA